MINEEYLRKGIFYVHGTDADNYFSIQLEKGFTILKIKSKGQVLERKFTGLLWQSNRSLPAARKLIEAHGLGQLNVTEVIDDYEGYKAWVEEQEDVVEYDKGDTIYTSMVSNDKLHEQIIDDTGEGKYVYLNDGSTKTIDKIEHDGICYLPIVDDATKERAVLLPSDIGEYESVEKLIEEIQEHIKKYLDVSPDYVVFASYYVLLSWVYDRLNTLPYLRALGDTGTGKSRFLRILGGLCYKPIIVSGAITPAPIYRLIKRWKGTLVIDEADFKDSGEKNEVITILNCGFERDKPVVRCEKDNPDNVQILPTFSPKVIATRQTFKDKALESRCLTEIMKQTKRRNLPRILLDDFYADEMKLRNKLLRFRFDYYDKIDVNEIKNIDLGKLEPRLEQATISFAVLFYNIPEVFDKFKTFLVGYQQDLIEERATSYDGQIITALLNMIEEGAKEVTPADIVEVLKEDKFDTTAAVVGKHLKALGIKTVAKKIGGKTCRLIELSDEQRDDLNSRYNPEKVTAVTAVTDNMGESISKFGLDRDSCNPNSPSEYPNTSVTPETPVTEMCGSCHQLRVLVGKKHLRDEVTGKLEEFDVCEECM